MRHYDRNISLVLTHSSCRVLQQSRIAFHNCLLVFATKTCPSYLQMILWFREHHSLLPSLLASLQPNYWDTDAMESAWIMYWDSSFRCHPRFRCSRGRCERATKVIKHSALWRTLLLRIRPRWAVSTGRISLGTSIAWLRSIALYLPVSKHSEALS